MRRLRLAFAALAVTGCAKIIGVPDLTYDAKAEAGVPNDIRDGATPGPDGAVLPGNDAAACGGANLAGDKLNCGRCGHACGPGDCTNGACQPFTIAQGITALEQFSLVGDWIYYGAYGDSEGTVHRAKKDGSGTTETLVTGVTNGPVGVATNGTTLFYANTAGVFACTIGTNACTGSHKAYNHTYARYLGLAGSSLVMGTENGVFHAVIGGSENTIKGSVDQPIAWFVTQSATDAYFTGQLSGLYRNPLDGSGADPAPTIVDTDSYYDVSIVAIDGDRLFYAYKSIASGSGIVASALQATPTSRITYTSKGNVPLGVAADANNVYWSERGDLVTPTDAQSAAVGNGALRTCPRAGCADAPVTLVDKLHGSGLIVLDDAFVYYGENNNYTADGRIRAVAKP